MMKNISMILGLMLILMSFRANSETLNAGPWSFQLKMTYGTVPFIINFDKKKNKLTGVLENGKETIKLKNIRVVDKSVIIPLQNYDMTLEMSAPNEGAMTGFLIRHNKNPKVKTPVIAIRGKSERFPEKKNKPKINISGRWSVTLTNEQDIKEPGIIIFEQQDEKLHGSILTPTGDYRYMEGYVSGIEFKAASFDGSYNYLLKGRVLDGKLDGKILSSTVTEVKGFKDENAKLPDAYKQTQLEEALSFSFPDIDGNKVSLEDPKFKDKPVIVQFFGSWCPNCNDEMNFLIPWYNKNKDRGIEIVALAFERSVGPQEAKIQLKKIIKRKKIPYTLLIGGSTSEDKPKDKIKGLKNFIAFPTTVFLNKKHEVVKIHAGFTGPSTGEFFENWKTEFEQTVNELLK
jgi:thiol-disulfide isomerase/thioredoxin